MGLNNFPQTVGCKYCGMKVLLEIKNITPNKTGIATTKLCKCGKASSYVFTLTDGYLIELR